MKMLLSALFALLVGAAAVSAQTTSHDLTHAERIFAESHSAVTRLPLPPYIVFTLQDNGHSDQDYQHELLRVLVRTADGYAVVVPLKTAAGDAIAHPTPILIKGPRYTGLSYIIGLGDFPLDDFGMRLGGIRRQGMFDAPGTPEPEPTDLRSIATVHAYNPGYAVSDLGDEVLDGHSVYHFGLRPLRDTKHHPLREIWIDTSTLLPVRYMAAIPVSYENDNGFVASNWATIYTQMIDGHLTNQRVEGRFNLEVSLANVTGVVNWTVSEVAFPTAEPDWVFDVAQWSAHLGESIPNLAPQ